MVTTLTQEVGYPSLDAASYAGDLAQQRIFNCAYGASLGVCNTTTLNFTEGVNVSSVATATRRTVGASVGYSTVIQQPAPPPTPPGATPAPTPPSLAAQAAAAAASVNASALAANAAEAAATETSQSGVPAPAASPAATVSPAPPPVAVTVPGTAAPTPPTTAPTQYPTQQPTTNFPTAFPTATPTGYPTYTPTDAPTNYPTYAPTQAVPYYTTWTTTEATSQGLPTTIGTKLNRTQAQIACPAYAPGYAAQNTWTSQAPAWEGGGADGPATCAPVQVPGNSTIVYNVRNYFGCDSEQAVLAEACVPTGLSIGNGYPFVSSLKSNYTSNASLTDCNCGDDGYASIYRGAGCYVAIPAGGNTSVTYVNFDGISGCGEAPPEISQTISFSGAGFSALNYTGELQAYTERAYALSINITTENLAGGTYIDGISALTSYAEQGRRQDSFNSILRTSFVQQAYDQALQDFVSQKALALASDLAIFTNNFVNNVGTPASISSGLTAAGIADPIVPAPATRAPTPPCPPTGCPPTPAPTSSSSSSGLSSGAIAGIVIGSIVGVVIIVGIIAYFLMAPSSGGTDPSAGFKDEASSGKI